MTAEEAFKEIPAIEPEDGTVGEISECGCGVYWQIANGIKEDDYHAYLKALEQSGYVRYMNVELGHKYRSMNATFRKEKQKVAVTYNEYWKRIYIITHEDYNSPAYSAEEVFKEIPDMEIAGYRVLDAVHYGAGNYVITADGTEKADYENYLSKLETAGFIKYVDNGDGLNGCVWNSVYTKDNLSVTVTYVKNLHKTYISACFDLPLSEHLLYDKTSVSKNPVDAKTKLHMPELWFFGNSFIFQLKNGHFIVSDGGTGNEAGYLLDYLESLTPNGEKPVVEAWFISHAHWDHAGVLRYIVSDRQEYAGRLYVDGFYYNEPNDNVMNFDQPVRTDIYLLRQVPEYFRTSKGEKTKIYRPQTGQRYYFNDITVDIVLGQEQLPGEQYSGDFNDSSTWCMFTVEGQKCLLGGDGDTGGMQFIMDTYDREYLKVDLFTTLHHCINTTYEFTDYCTVKTVLATRRGEPTVRVEKNQHLKEAAQEWLTFGDGTRVLTFPYEIGTSECLPHLEWIYHKDVERAKDVG